MRNLVFAMTLLIASAASAEPLTIARLFANPALSGPAPTALKVAPDGSRVTFLRGRPDAQNQLDLWQYEVASGKTELLVDSRLLANGPEALSDAEKARRERLRIAALSGIVEYQFSPDGKRLLFPLGGDLYLYDLARHGAEAVTKLTHGEGFATDARISPKGRYVSFVRDARLVVIEIASGNEVVLGIDGPPAISWATAEFVAQEEMDRFTGYWWAPDDSAVALTRVDETDVPLQKRFEVYPDRTEIVEQRYPAAGQPNAKVELFVVRLAEIREEPEPPARGVLRNGDLGDVNFEQGRTIIYRRIDLGANADQYLARVDWLADSSGVAFQRQSRDQRTLELIAQDLNTGTQRTLQTEHARTWVSLNDDLRFLNHGKGFVWSSERNGTRQLLAFGSDGKLDRELTPKNWSVDRLLAVNEKTGMLFFSGHDQRDPLVKHVYAAGLDGKSPPQQISSKLSWHEAVFAADASIFIDTASDPQTPPQVSLYGSDGKQLAVLEANALDGQHPYAPYRPLHRVPTYGVLKADDGQELHFGYVTPPDFDPTRRYPVILRFYGGPGRQFVTKAWTSGANTGLTDLLTQYWAQRGFVVFALDNRGTPRRSKAFEDAIFRQLGKVEVADQLEGVKWLSSQPWVDAQHIGCFGWSYGGFQTLMLLGKASERIAAGVAVAPVTDWMLYDTHYTERYLDHPKANAEGYAASGIFAHLDGLKSPLLLMHGMADDNVLFANSTKLMAELQQREIPFELMTYPGAKHGITGQANRTHVYSTIDEFLRRNLMVAAAPAAPSPVIERTVEPEQISAPAQQPADPDSAQDQ